MKYLNCNSFTWETYCGAVGYSMYGILNNSKYYSVKLEDIEAIAFCDASTIPIRPRKNEFAIFFIHKPSGEEFWGHVLKYELNQLGLIDIEEINRIERTYGDDDAVHKKLISKLNHL